MGWSGSIGAATVVVSMTVRRLGFLEFSGKVVMPRCGPFVVTLARCRDLGNHSTMWTRF